MKIGGTSVELSGIVLKYVGYISFKEGNFDAFPKTTQKYIGIGLIIAVRFTPVVISIKTARFTHHWILSQANTC